MAESAAMIFELNEIFMSGVLHEPRFVSQRYARDASLFPKLFQAHRRSMGLVVYRVTDSSLREFARANKSALSCDTALIISVERRRSLKAQNARRIKLL